MAGKRIVYQNWIADLGYDPLKRAWLNSERSPEKKLVSLDEVDQKELCEKSRGNDYRDDPRLKMLEEAVKGAMASLSENEREFIRQFHYMGRTYREIAEDSGRAIYRLEALHRRALKKLRRKLAGFVRQEFDIETADRPDCIICRSENLAEINLLIADRDPADTWKPVMQAIEKNFGIKILSPQLLIGHLRYHQ